MAIQRQLEWNIRAVSSDMKVENETRAGEKTWAKLRYSLRMKTKQGFLQDRCVWSGLHICEQWVYKVGDSKSKDGN